MQAAQKLDDILASAPQSGAVDLSRHQIDDLGALLPRLAELTQLRRLDLSGNALSHLPQDIGLALPALAALDIRANRFRAGGVDVHEGRVPVVLVPDLEERAPRCGDRAGRHNSSPQGSGEECGEHVGFCTTKHKENHNT